ncbi:hypothetical protein [Erythrobacter sp.]|uniref:hypothetical protein n=1 Tax=Erythrobacter sp. TaxID=1042 RepID=UPI0025CDBF7D|nr:hypothetical protein [Erythrobacter sp.]
MVSKSGDSGAQGSCLRLAWGLGLAGVALLGFSAITIYDFVDAVSGSAPIIIWDTGGWIALPIALALLALALGLYIGRHHGQDVDGPRRDWIKRLLVLPACLLPFVIVFPLGAYWLAGLHLQAQRYTACGEGFWIAAARMPNAEAARAPCDI